MEQLPLIPNNFKLSVIPNTRKQFNAVKEQLFRKDIDEVIIATDAGREGELVARWILVKTGCKKPLKRFCCCKSRGRLGSWYKCIKSVNMSL